MKEIKIRVDNCRACIYCSWDDLLCDHRKIGGAGVNENGEIPDWCPLEDVEDGAKI